MIEEESKNVISQRQIEMDSLMLKLKPLGLKIKEVHLRVFTMLWMYFMNMKGARKACATTQVYILHLLWI